MRWAYIGLGANVGDRKAALDRARAALRAAYGRIRCSSIYETAPLYDVDQPPFWNQVVAVPAAEAPPAMLERLLRIEAGLGRVRTRPNGPRTIDLDLLLWGDAVIETASLTVPHPRLLERAFALVPLVELAPDLVHPKTGRPLREALFGVRTQRIRRVQGGETSCG
ncbi:2-amino-4-hydroxy-6-hydroxymethyldihydropteridine diphosphokinase [Hydrogenibacillus sp. N12]|uniref:2-amino-4-hydroxy-6- hydroxymethyldihydropteridine diphosphokinase n=1 Tax=Hydrogenibacillus sp. N12 TaxID=2866627 RepID=UPI001C7CB8B2|nr:2-amino-4-hydroxy-6-hydroxymethyldihydropteridine diphosphokinase [Hydrogenibacillus sp. N12]QZA33087.1 2-amino-4-hydroxy-6-hydroxymethyldihydropteridine diphosphokinase [Hydrogenibacillus sp. N12]